MVEQPENIYIISTNNPLPEPILVNSGEALTEQYEGVLIRMENVECTTLPGGFGVWQVDDGSGSCGIHNTPDGYEFDQINLNTILLHTTEKITQPWRAGLSLNSRIPPLFKFIPRAPIYKLFGKDLTKGREHPHQAVTDFFFKELALCLSENIISSQELDNAIQKKFIRSLILFQENLFY